MTGFFLVYSRLQVQTLLIQKRLLDDYTEALTVKTKDRGVFLWYVSFNAMAKKDFWGCQHCISADSYRRTRRCARATLETGETESPFLPHNIVINLHKGCCCIEFAQISIWQALWLLHVISKKNLPERKIARKIIQTPQQWQQSHDLLKDQSDKNRSELHTHEAFLGISTAYPSTSHHNKA